MSLRKFINKFIGSQEELPMEIRVYNAVILIVFCVLFFFLILNIILVKYNAIVLILVVALMQYALYYLANVKKQFKISLIGNGLLGYLALGVNYFLDYGSYGPTIFLSFLTFELLIAITDRKQHLLWILLHTLFAITMIGIEYKYPQAIINPYHSTKSRIYDMLLSYVSTLAFIYVITYYLRANYINEKKLADIHAQTIATQKVAVESSEAKLRAFFNNSASSHILIGHNMQILDFNGMAASVIRNMYAKEMFIGDSMLDFVTPGYLARFIENCNRVMSGEVIIDENRSEYANSKVVIWWQLSFAPAIDNKGRIWGVAFNATDITERKQQEEKIRAKNEALTKIAFIQSHEFRGPLTSIVGLMNIIKEENYEHPQEYLLMMEKAVQQLDERIHTVIRQTEQLPGEY